MFWRGGIDNFRHLRWERRCTLMLDDPAAQKIGIKPMREGDGSDGDAWLPAGGNHLCFEFGAVPAAPATGLAYLFGSVHVSTYLEVDTILARPPSLFKTEWPNAYV